MTYLEFLDVTGGYFAKNGVDSPRLTAELMLADALGVKRMQLYLNFEKEVPAEALDRLRPLAKRRAQGEPLQYVLGHTDFAGARFTVTPDVLIPRPETELLFDRIATLLDPQGGPVADIGTGSGILAVSLARKFPSLAFHAVDVSEAALAVARKNGEGVTNLTFHHGDLLAPLAGVALQALVANLPYIPTAVVPTLTREVRREPVLALDGGPDGLDLVHRLLAENAGKATLVGLEIGDGQGEAATGALKESGYPIVEAIKDLRGGTRILIGRKST